MLRNDNNTMYGKGELEERKGLNLKGYNFLCSVRNFEREKFRKKKFEGSKSLLIFYNQISQTLCFD